MLARMISFGSTSVLMAMIAPLVRVVSDDPDGWSTQLFPPLQSPTASPPLFFFLSSSDSSANIVPTKNAARAKARSADSPPDLVNNRFIDTSNGLSPNSEHFAV